MALSTVTDASFDADVVHAGGPVLVLFWAEWDGASRLVKSNLEKVAPNYAGRLTAASLNIDQNPDTLPRYNEKAIPVMLLFRGGAVVAKRVGAQSEGQLTEFLDSSL